MKNVKQCVLGNGEIGRGVSEVLKCPAFDTEGTDGTYDVIHICYPFSVNFERITQKYQVDTEASVVVVHSTVPVGTCDKHNWVHSPVRGRHPHLAEGVQKFTKFFGGDFAPVVAQLFADKGVDVVVTDVAANTEAMKLWDTTQYGVNIVLQKMIFEYCKERDLDFDIVYTQANKTYNEGYEKLGEPQFKKYILEHKEGPIGGHCVMQNITLLNVKKITQWITKN